jgi:magnesium transporter
MITKPRKIIIMEEAIRKFLHRGALNRVINVVDKSHSADLAVIVQDLNEHDKCSLFQVLYNHNIKLAAKIMSETEPQTAKQILLKLDVEKIAKLLQELPSDDAAMIIGYLPQEQADEVLEKMRKKELTDLQGLLQYGEETAGRIMTTDVFALREDTLVKDAITALQGKADVEMVFYLYVVGKYSHLLGVISLRRLIVTSPNTKLKDIMEREVVSVRTGMDQEEVARIVEKYDILAVPVVDDENKLVGIITVDDVLDIIREEATEDFLKMAGVGEEVILTKSFFRNFWYKLPWLFIPWLGEIAAAKVIGGFSGVLSKIVISLAAFIPIVMGMGGNIATQTSTIIVRGLATGRVNIGNLWRVLMREIGVASLLGVTYGVMLTAFAKFQQKETLIFSLTLGLSICAAMIVAASVGSFGPIILKKIGADPAVASGPFVTTATDILGSVVYFYLAYVILL